MIQSNKRISNDKIIEMIVLGIVIDGAIFHLGNLETIKRLTDGAYLLSLGIRYSFSDVLWAAAGVMFFGGGEEWNQFGQFDRNDNIYLQVRYEF